ncbi:septal ring lytic transglycosylase RlpA family lipoprotein [Pseudomonas sp. HAR-UPW-AIA-41]|uniref:septal ring lytic transglycosylase RlpA family protein n=1 Tax=Pseudomonas sp. HAR-UPW-AIA-41 TaxID=1985301 RepID=UPI000BB2DF40|nr:septal ring lytic transglycosylase RlpA family protein [Pseudomonas sp. HAR-UPW-AIA-41]PAV47668.1 septal ring lytic transglycosylase RlpA family lipoprotein [Pseudomonas sp. HAR-UPW-AIA-41]
MHKPLAALLLFSLLAGCARQLPVEPVTTPVVTPKPVAQAAPPVRPQPRYQLIGQGKASYYAARLNGRRTASGERLDNADLTGAHRELPFGSLVRVTNLANQQSVIVRINDRGPHGGGRIIDVSRQAAEQLGMLRSGTAQVKLEQLGD